MRLSSHGKLQAIVESQKHLGLILDEKLSFKSHIEEKITKTNKGVGLFKKMASYVPRKTLLTVYLIFAFSFSFFSRPILWRYHLCLAEVWADICCFVLPVCVFVYIHVFICFHFIMVCPCNFYFHEYKIYIYIYKTPFTLCRRRL